MASNSKVAKVGKSAKFIAVQKLERELICKLEYDIINGKVEDEKKLTTRFNECWKEQFGKTS